MSAGAADARAVARGRAGIACTRSIRDRTASYEDGRHGAAVPASQPVTMRTGHSDHEIMPGSSRPRRDRCGPAGARRRANRVLSTARSRLEPTAAGRIWRQLSELGFVNGSLQFAAAFTLGFIPFLMLLSAALGPGLTHAIAIRNRPIGTVITLLTAEIGLAVALQLGAAIGAAIGRREDATAIPQDEGPHQPPGTWPFCRGQCTHRTFTRER